MIEHYPILLINSVLLSMVISFLLFADIRLMMKNRKKIYINDEDGRWFCLYRSVCTFKYLNPLIQVLYSIPSKVNN